jgi:heat shock protein HslJ/uncharacterized lipoprotein NlpE involved in copper resistance
MKAALIPFTILAMLLFGYAQEKEAQVPSGPAATKPPDSHTSQNSLDWSGVYKGVLPCADCPGIKTRLTLNRDGTFARVTQFMGRQNATETVGGRFAWQANGNAITLDEHGGGQQYSVGEGRLTLLRQEGGRGGSGAPNRVLTMVPQKVAGDDLVHQLERYRWTLASATDSQNRRIDGLPPGKDHPVVFSFSGSRLSIQGACNRIVGAYQIDAARRLTVNGRASTMMACDAALMQADTALSAALAKPLRVEMKSRPSPWLRLTSASSSTLTFTGQPTPESLYGAPTIMFFEVSAKLVPCKNPPPPNTNCLQVRERHYDEKGLVVGTPGEWRPLEQNIEGFTHKQGERNVLRVKRFNRTAGPDGASSTVYVMDLMVESETVTP